MNERLTELAYGAGWSLIKTLPESVTWAAFKAGADRSAAKPGRGTRQLAANLRRVVGPDVADEELAQLVRAGLRSYARYWLEAFRLPTISRPGLLEGFTLVDKHRIGDAIAAGTGCVIALSHSGNWDYAGAYVMAHGWPITTVAERLKPEGVYRRFLAYRESLGMEIIPTEGAERSPLVLCEEAIGRNRVVPLLADRDLSARGVEVSFFDGTTRMPAGPATLALRTGAPLVVVQLWYDGLRPVGRCLPPIALPTEGPLDARVRQVTQQIADALAEGIAAHPSDWHMLQRLWLS